MISFVLVILGFIAGIKYEKGVQARATIVAIQKQDTQHAKDEQTVENQESKYDVETLKPLTVPAPVFSLCPSYNSSVRAPAKPKSANHADPALRGPDTGGAPPKPVEWDSRGVVQAGRDADLLIGALQTYITTVCRPN